MISLLIPFYNEEAQIPLTLSSCVPILDGLDDYEIICVDDGSNDGSWAAILNACQTNSRIRGLHFARNFGKEAAICAAMDAAAGDCVVLIDGDLQHPPQLIPEMFRLWKNEGYEVVEAVKTTRGRESLFSRIAANSFYKLFADAGNMQLKNASDFKLMDRKVVEAYKQMPERHTFFRGMSAWLGFRRTSVPFEVAERQTGVSKWNLRKKIQLSVDAISSFSSKPLHMITILGTLFTIAGLILAIETLILYFYGKSASGFTTVILLQLIIGGLVLFSLGLTGLYISRIYDEVKLRPRYIISRDTANEEAD
ncbi:MAG: glycosyltransferase family 2 protein [Eubacteriales bacterium]|nr:glycosyltransferase family 2 protein [Eubacteriales bacterium]